MRGEMPEVVHRPAQYRDLEAALVVEMHMHRRQRQIVVVVECAGQPFGRLAVAALVYVYDHKGRALGRALV